MIPTANEFAGILNEMADILASKGFKPQRGVRRGALSGARLFEKPTDNGSPFRVVVYCEDLQGNMQTAAHTAYLCGRLFPKLVISAGIAGSFDPTKAWIGDVILPSKVEYASFNKIYQPGDTNAPQNAPGLQLSVESGHSLSPVRVTKKGEKNLRGAVAIVDGIPANDVLTTVAYPAVDPKADARTAVFNSLSAYLQTAFGIVAKAPKNPRVIRNVNTFSWDKVFDSRDLYQYLLKTDRLTKDAICVEMESLGFLTATDLSRLSQDFDVLIVRAISDIVGCKGATHNPDHDLEGEARALAMSNVAKVVCQYVGDQY
jgi:nucleoside phosphorylase